jgi:elongation factor Tu
MNVVDTYIKEPVRLIDAPLILAVESVLVAKGRGTVVTGKVEQGKITVNDD